MLNEMSPYILLGFLIAGVMHAFIPQKTFARHLSGTGAGPVLKSALIGVPLPLCSCGVLPTAIAMKRNGASRAATTSFLISTPQTGVDSIAATWSLLGPAFAVIRPIAAFVTAIFGGIAVGRGEEAAAEAHCTDGCCDDHEHNPEHDHEHKSFGRKCVDALRYGYVDLVGSIGGWLVAGLIIAALITVYVPADFFAFMGRNPLMSMIAVLIVAIPMYICATGSIPIAMSLMLKGLSPGTALVMLMAGPAANFASFTLISREMGRRAAITYITSIIIGSILFGLTIDYLLPSQWFLLPGGASAGHAHHFSTFSLICSGVLAALLLWAVIRRYIPENNIKNREMTTEFNILGMNCPHCQASVGKAIEAVSGVTAVNVDLKGAKATVEGTPDADAVIAAVRAAGFDANLAN